MYATIAWRSVGFKLARCDILFTISGQSSTLYRQSGGSVWHSMQRETKSERPSRNVAR
jgi:hypothetical protein